MKWRLDEGNDTCYYFLGINSSLYKTIILDINYSFKIIKTLEKL